MAMVINPFIGIDDHSISFINIDYPLVMTDIAMENHHFQWENPL